MEKQLCGIWRSYQVFHFSGKIEKNQEENYLELSVDQDGCCIIQNAPDRRVCVYQPGQWEITPIKKRNFLYLDKKQVYEVITLELSNLVLNKILTGEKIFMAPLEEWSKKLQQVQTIYGIAASKIKAFEKQNNIHQNT